MKVLSTPRHQRHQPPAEIFEGQAIDHQEQPARIELILNALPASYERQTVNQTVPQSILAAVHQVDYLDFLRRSERELNDQYLYPSVFRPHLATHGQFRNFLTQFGQYSFDMFTPINSQTWPAALDSASATYQAANQLINEPNQTIYCLVRPPGHHAEPGQMGGYCYLNNAAVAAQTLSIQGTVVVLDLDFHHGNGTQHIFYERADVLTISLHAEPEQKFPYFSGWANERGRGKGLNFNHNFPLPLGTTNDDYQLALDKALETLTNFNPDFLITCFGSDTHQADPIGGFKLTTPFYHQLAQRLAQLSLPTIVVQEGGYNLTTISDIVNQFLSGFKS